MKFSILIPFFAFFISFVLADDFFDSNSLEDSSSPFSVGDDSFNDDGFGTGPYNALPDPFFTGSKGWKGGRTGPNSEAWTYSNVEGDDIPSKNKILNDKAKYDDKGDKGVKVEEKKD
ncbi:uncharacterized protein JCM6883_004874 [Sporobolomyces salmoneus]|uniref:uncharacterized protein n=1 Tax=Sporobolomyces salmoneus TaxID=183962 RepID=UPI0031708904